jgi:hypothetical protein
MVRRVMIESENENRSESGIDAGMDGGAKVGLLKLIYYMLSDQGEESAAAAVADTIFLMTAADAVRDGGTGVDWHLFRPLKAKEPEDGGQPGREWTS